MFPTGYVQIPRADYRRDELSVPADPEISVPSSRDQEMSVLALKKPSAPPPGGPLTEMLPTNAALRQADPTQLAQIASG
jgi:hypothetical protein